MESAEERATNNTSQLEDSDSVHTKTDERTRRKQGRQARLKVDGSELIQNRGSENGANTDHDNDSSDNTLTVTEPVRNVRKSEMNRAKTRAPSSKSLRKASPDSKEEESDSEINSQPGAFRSTRSKSKTSRSQMRTSYRKTKRDCEPYNTGDETDSQVDTDRIIENENKSNEMKRKTPRRKAKRKAAHVQEISDVETDSQPETMKSTETGKRIDRAKSKTPLRRASRSGAAVQEEDDNELDSPPGKRAHRVTKTPRRGKARNDEYENDEGISERKNDSQFEKTKNTRNEHQRIVAQHKTYALRSSGKNASPKKGVTGLEDKRVQESYTDIAECVDFQKVQSSSVESIQIIEDESPEETKRSRVKPERQSIYITSEESEKSRIKPELKFVNNEDELDEETKIVRTRPRRKTALDAVRKFTQKSDTESDTETIKSTRSKRKQFQNQNAEGTPLDKGKCFSLLFSHRLLSVIHLNALTCLFFKMFFVIFSYLSRNVF